MRRSSWARTRSSSCAATASPSPTSTARPPTSASSTSTGTPPPPRRAATTTSCSRRSPSSPRRSPTPCSAGSTARAAPPRRDAPPRRGAARGRQGRHRLLRHGFHAGLIAKYAIEHWTRIPCETELATEFRYRDPILDPRTLVIAISQSGETMDTLMAVRHAREQGAKVLAICNTNGSTIPRESDAVLYTHAGPEVAVASTKAFLTQLVACYLVGLYLGAGARHQVRRRDPRRGAPALRDARRRSRGAGDHRAGARAGPLAHRRRTPCCSWAATSATRSRSKARSSSRNSPTCTPRASPPASSSTARSR